MADRRGVYRAVYSTLLDDPDFQVMTPPSRHTLLTLRLCTQNTPACLFRAYPAVLTAQTGYPVRVLRLAVAELVKDQWLDCEGPWETLGGPFLVWIRNGLRYDPSLRLADPKHQKAVVRAISAFGRSPLVAKFCDYYKIVWPFEGPPEAHRRPSEDLSSPRPIPRPIPRPNTETDISPGSPETLWPSPEALVQLYNDLTPDETAAVTTLSPARRKKALEYLRQFPEEAWWREVFAQMHRSRFLRGLTPKQPGHKSFTPDFDWLLSCGKDGTENAVKVHDGRYLDG